MLGNLRFQKTLLFLFFLSPLIGFSQTFTSSEGILSAPYYSGGVMGVADANMDGYDDIIIMDQGDNLFIEYQNPDGTYSGHFFTSVSSSNQWGMAVGDLDNDGHIDVVSGNSNANYVNIDGPGAYTLSQLPETGGDFIFAQGISFGDINNDGALDVFGCDDVDISDIWGNDGSGNFSENDNWIPLATVVPSDNSGNYGSVFTDYDCDGDLDLYIAKCRQGVNDPNDPRRINVMYQNDGNNNFTEVAGAIGLQPLEQSWTADFADIDNDGDFDCLLTNHSTTLLLYENDGTGNFTDITAGSGLELTGFFLQAKFHDFDNDGYVDLLYAGGTHKYMKNDGDQTFTEVVDPMGTSTMHSFGIGDLNHDGWLDVWANYGSGYVTPSGNQDKLWMNDGGSNNWVQFQLTGYESNKNAVGAKVKIHGSFGTQVREIRAGESYGITNTFSCHFGLGTETVIDYAEVFWPSGLYSYIDDPASNVFHSVHEIEGCTDPASCTYNPLASIDDGSCSYSDPCEGCTDNTACNYIPAAEVDNGTCTYPGCDNPSACNYDPTAGCNDGSCLLGGCTDPLACNYNASAGCDDGSCIFGVSNDACAGAIPLIPGVSPISNLGTCNDDGISIPATGCNNTTGWCEGNVTVGVWYSFTTPAEDTEISIETLYDGSGTWEDTQLAIFDACGGNLVAANDDSGADGYQSLLNFGCGELAANTTYLILLDGWNGDTGTALIEIIFDSTNCGGEGCMDPTACNYDVGATIDVGCTYPGCTDPGACNYDALAGCDDGSCSEPDGCTDPTACNYDALATCDDGSCILPDGCTDPTACNYDALAICDDGSCILPDGCTDPTACNYDALATCDDGSCILPDGCTDPTACNYDASATCDDGSCILPDGCTDPTACNYDALATCDDGSCI